MATRSGGSMPSLSYAEIAGGKRAALEAMIEALKAKHSKAAQEAAAAARLKAAEKATAAAKAVDKAAAQAAADVAARKNGPLELKDKLVVRVPSQAREPQARRRGRQGHDGPAAGVPAQGLRPADGGHPAERRGAPKAQVQPRRVRVQRHRRRGDGRRKAARVCRVGGRAPG